MTERRKPRSPLDHKPDEVRKARERTGLTRTEVARQLGVSLSLISEIEKGTRNATPAMILRLADALDCEPDSLRRRRLGARQAMPPRQGVAA
jgi:transcriptional regulator with XRE-family HTH domain